LTDKQRVRRIIVTDITDVVVSPIRDHHVFGDEAGALKLKGLRDCIDSGDTNRTRSSTDEVAVCTKVAWIDKKVERAVEDRGKRQVTKGGSNQNLSRNTWEGIHNAKVQIGVPKGPVEGAINGCGAATRRYGEGSAAIACPSARGPVGYAVNDKAGATVEG
jgi:hypothetical protein